MPNSAKIKAAGIYLRPEEQEQLKEIAEELGVTPHALRRYAVLKLLKDWQRGWRPKRKKKVTQTLEL